MGLDITAYSKLRHIGDHEFDPELNEGEPGPWCFYDGHVQSWAYSDFTASFRGIPILTTRDGLSHGGCLEITSETQTHGFRAGSYSGYNAWRSDLASQFNPDGDEGKPFYELIWFADNEGAIGPDAAKDLLEDFRAHADVYAPPRRWGAGLAEVYADWTRAFELAADGGLVNFH
jgi:hypothetical protein